MQKGIVSIENPSHFVAAMEGLGNVVTDEMNNVLNTEADSEEIKSVVQMHPNRSLGPDGMNTLFFQKFWIVMEADVISLVKKWWHGLVDLTMIKIHILC